MATNDGWLALTKETALEPDLPICDPHHHLWDFKHERVAPRYLLDEILEDIKGSGHNVVSTVFIECSTMYRTDGPEPMRAIGETEFANGIAAMSASGLYGPTRVAAGIIGTADLTLGNAVGEVLDAQIAAGGGRFRGIRHGVKWDASDIIPNARSNSPPGLFLDGKFREGFGQLARRGLTFEAWCYHPQIPELTDLARAFPDTTIIVNHFAGPLGVGPYADKRDAVFAQWRAEFAELSSCSNVVAKLGGLNMDFNGYRWHEQKKPPTSEELLAATRRYFDHALGQFGVERCMFESNFPVDKLSCSYAVVWNSFKRLAADYSADEKAALFHDTATRIYRLGGQQ